MFATVISNMATLVPSSACYLEHSLEVSCCKPQQAVRFSVIRQAQISLNDTMYCRGCSDLITLWVAVEPDVVDSLLDDVDSLQIQTTDSDHEPQTNKFHVKPYRRAAPDIDNIKVFIHGHLRGLSTIFHVPWQIRYYCATLTRGRIMCCRLAALPSVCLSVCMTVSPSLRFSRNRKFVETFDLVEI